MTSGRGRGRDNRASGRAVGPAGAAAPPGVPVGPSAPAAGDTQSGPAGSGSAPGSSPAEGGRRHAKPTRGLGRQGKLAADAVAEPAAEAATESAFAPAFAPAVESSAEPVVESVVEPSEPVLDPVVEPYADPVVEPRHATGMARPAASDPGGAFAVRRPPRRRVLPPRHSASAAPALPPTPYPPAASDPPPPPGAGAAAAAAREPTSVEIRLVPAGSRGQIRRLRLTRRRLTVVSVLALLYLFFLAFAAATAPGVIRGLFGSEEYRALTTGRAGQGERLQHLVARLGTMQAQSERLRLQVRRVALAYDLPPAPPTSAAPAAPSAVPASRASMASMASTAAMPPTGAVVARPGPPDRPAGEGRVSSSAGVDSEDEAAGGSSIYSAAIEQGERMRARMRGQLGALDAGLAQIRAIEVAHPEVVRETPASCPLRGDHYVLTNRFGRQRSAYTHDFYFNAGLDLAAPRGTPVLATADGVVTFAGVYPLNRSPYWWRYGNLVAVANGERFITLFGHCGDVKVKAGQTVRRGDALATVGSSGWSLNPHLHYEVRKRQPGGEPRPVDPLIYILDRRWQTDERQPALGSAAAPALTGGAGASVFEPLPPGLLEGRPGHPSHAGRRQRLGSGGG
jgi:murein DD-endopeptidase MepM/ murein hydrolase activator NlpD